MNDRLEVNDNAFAQTIWQTSALQDLIRQSVMSGQASWGGDVVGLNPRIRIYRYKEGQFFAPHCRFQAFFSYQHVSARKRALSKDLSYDREPTRCPCKTGPVNVSGFRTLLSLPSICMPLLLAPANMAEQIYVKALSIRVGGRADTVIESTSNLSSLVRTNSFELDCACFEGAMKTYAYPRCKAYTHMCQNITILINSR